MKIDEGIPVEDGKYVSEYRAGYAWGLANAYMVPRDTRRRISHQAAKDAFSRGIRDALEGNAPAFERGSNHGQ